MRRFLNGEIALGFLLASLFWIGVLGWQSQQSEQPKNQQPSVTEEQHRDSGSAVTYPVAKEDRGKGKQEGKWYSPFTDHAPDWFVAIFTGLLTYVTYRLVNTTGGLKDSTDKLWKAGERQIETVRQIASVQTRLTRQQITIAKESADAAKASAEAVVTQLRSNISIKTIDLTNLDGPEPMQAIIIFENFGQTPAYNFTMWSAFSFRPDGYVGPFPMRDEAAAGSNSILAQRSEIEQGHVIPLTHEQRVALATKKATLYVFGDIRYRDAFKNDRFYRYRFMCGGEAGMRTFKNEGGQWVGLLSPCPEGNEAN